MLNSLQNAESRNRGVAVYENADHLAGASCESLGADVRLIIHFPGCPADFFRDLLTETDRTASACGKHCRHRSLGDSQSMCNIYQPCLFCMPDHRFSLFSD